MKHIAIAGTPEGAANFIAALEALRATGTPVLEGDDRDYDGLILPGGDDIDPALFGAENQGSREIDRDRDLQQLQLLHHFVQAKKPILGVCKGHQLLNVYFGGGLCQHIPQYLQHQRIDGRDQAHAVRCEAGCLLEKLYGPEFPVNSAHHQAVDTPAPGLRAVAWAEDGVLEAMVHESLPILGVQWHPERMCLQHRREDTVDGLPLFAWYLSMEQGVGI